MKYIILFLFLSYISYSQYYHAPIDTLIAFSPGIGQYSGQALEYFPANIFKLPDSTARVEVPASAPEQICSIGLGGEIIIGFKNFIIADGPGPDFVIFENAFLNPVNNKVFAEPAVVSVSLDGINYIEFPYDSMTLAGCAGINPVNGAQNHYDCLISGGDCFDLAQINMNKARFIKIRDISYMPKYKQEHPYHDPIISGFDLDGIAGVNLELIQSDIINDQDSIKLRIQQINNELIIESAENNPFKLCIFNMLGQLIYQDQMISKSRINIAGFSSGIYVLQIQTTHHSYFQTIHLWP